MRLQTVILAALLSIASHSAVRAEDTAVFRDTIRVVGSSTVYPFVAAAAEQFGQIGKYKTPVVESTGTGGGIKLFCQGIGAHTPDFVSASRQMKKSEREECKKNGITDIHEIELGYDGIVLVNKKGAPALNISKQELFIALAREVPVKGRLVENPYKNWSEIDPKFPNVAIELYGPPPTSGTRDAFVELVMEEGCEHIPEMAVLIPDSKERKKRCGLMREDGAYIDAGEDDNIIVSKLGANENAFGVLGFSFYEENLTRLQANKVDGELPSYETIENGKYKVSRSLYVYAKGEHIAHVKGMRAFMKEMTHPAANGPDGYMTERGLLPLGKE